VVGDIVQLKSRTFKYPLVNREHAKQSARSDVFWFGKDEAVILFRSEKSAQLSNHGERSCWLSTLASSPRMTAHDAEGLSGDRHFWGLPGTDNFWWTGDRQR
jgi:hypothetical protein